MEPNNVTEERAARQTMSQLIEEIGSWSQNNFQEKQAPALGMLEEVGEAAHGILKAIQRIRGFDDPNKFRLHMRDAFGDAMIYTCNLAYNHGAFFSFARNVMEMPKGDYTDYQVLGHLLQVLGGIMNQETREMPDKQSEVNAYNMHLQRFCYIMEIWARQYDIDLREVTHATWLNIVMKRDWKKDTTEGGGHKHDE
jgi:NTP pyrophosphatase (non-canonical NTP hydrolase)